MKLFRTCCARLLAAIVSVSLISPVLVALFASAVQATTYPWDGGGGASSNFNNAANWNPDITPGSGDTALFNLGSAATYTVKFPGTGGFNPINFVNDSLVVRSNTVSFIETTANSTYTLSNSTTSNLGDRGIRIAPEAGDNAVLNDSLVSLSGVAATIGDSVGSHGTLNVNGGTFTLSGSDITNDVLIVGYQGNGTLNVTTGANANVNGQNATSTLGYAGGSTGTVAVSGTGSTWSSGNMYVGYLGTGTLGITNGGQVNSGSVALGYDSAASNGAVTVSGANSTWTTDDLSIGSSGLGIVDITDGGRVLIRGPGENVFLGEKLGTGTLTVDGTGSVLRGDAPTTHVNMYIGLAGTGALNITGGGQVSSTLGVVGAYLSAGVGTVIVDGTGSTWSNTLSVSVGYPGSGSLTVSNGGTVNVSGTLELRSQGTLQGNGNIAGVVYVGEGLVAPGLAAPVNSPGALHIDGNYSQSSSGTLQIQLANPQYDQLLVSGAVTLGGTLDVSLVNSFSPQSGNTFNILHWATRSGMFSTVNLPALAGSLQWDTSQLYTTGVLSVVAGVAGDYNKNGVVDAADYTIWRDTFGSTTDLRANGDNIGASANVIDQADFAFWKAHFGVPPGSGSGGNTNAAVPEPSTLVMLLLGMLAMFSRRPNVL
jgi:T5SS/PEP-CTERM-associated repeat protein